MQKNIFRLSLFNLRKNRREAVGIAFLTLITTFLLANFAANIAGFTNAFDISFDEAGGDDYLLPIYANEFRDAHYDILTEKYGIQDITAVKVLVNSSLRVTDSDGSGFNSYTLWFMTEDDELRLESFDKGDCMTDTEINALEHPVWLPEHFRIKGGYSAGDTFTFIYGGKSYPFTIAGFYNSGILSTDGFGFGCIISENDMIPLSVLFDEIYLPSFDYDGEFPYSEYRDICSERTGEDLNGFFFSRSSVRNSTARFLNIFLYMSAALSLVTLAASLFMIRHKISKDIEDQMQQIGVLEALGYKSREISLSYVYEYVTTGGIGAVLGGIAAVLFTPVMHSLTISFMGRPVESKTDFAAILLVTLLTVAVVMLFALSKAAEVKKYPPVTAFRKGIKTHHFGRNILPLEGLKKNINLRLALKGIFTDMRTNIGVGVCITLAGTAVLFSAYTFDFFKNGSDNLAMQMGCEIADTRIELMNSTDAKKFREELLAMPEVRKVLITTDMLAKVRIKNSSLDDGRVIVYDDFSETENLFLIDGRFPEYENEVVISLKRHRLENVNTGDSIIVQGDSVEASYIVTGIVNNMAFSQTSLYMTTEGYLHTHPTNIPRTVDVYLNDGVTREDFEKKLAAVYGANVEDTLSTETDDGTLEERIRRRADEKMAVMLSQYGVTDADYAIRIGDILIKGNSSRFAIKDISSMKDMVKTQCDPISQVSKMFGLGAMIFIGAVVAVILGILTSSNIKRQRRELGIMKSMGYSSKDLMTQTALRIMPVTLISAAAGAVLSVVINRYFWIIIFGADVQHYYTVTAAGTIMIVIFTYIVTYMAAGNVRKVSVTELMTE